MFIKVHEKITKKKIILNTEFIIRIYTDKDNDTIIDLACGRVVVVTSKTQHEIEDALFQAGVYVI